ncbi:hypothetical protein D9756_007816 [Leucocoprinus leucothites]|uniref:DUF4773 domain-containing protein n=1 Tax=Leucocoprinus leucothites TaxID=201217 RepID=A0A8H5FYF3_9AGAR|nr:hypothetical protein D9756_007816 [Leucoagaricus leucothites]
MRFIRNERALLNSICLLHVFVLFFVSATPSFNVSISPIHSSINYWPPESWTSTTLGCRGSVASISFFHSIQRLLEQGTAHYISPSRLSEQGGEQRRASASTTRSNSAARPSDQVSDRNDDWRKSTQLFCKCQQRIGDDCCCSEAEMSDAFGVTGHDPMVLQFRFTGSAVYLFGLTASSPSSLTSSDSPSSAPCISFAIDDEQLLILSTTGIASSEVESCSMKEPIFSHSGLSHDREHKLSVVISPSSVFLLSHLVYTTRRPITETHQPECPQPQSTPTTTTLMPNLSPPDQDARVQPASGILQHQVTLRPRTEAK